MHIAVLTDYPVVAFANGPSLATQALKRHLENRGHRVTIVGPRPAPDSPPPAPGSLLLESAPFAAHPGVHLPFAWPPEAFDNHQRFDVIHSHANSSAMHWAPMMRRLHGIPCLSTNTVYIPGFADYALPKTLTEIELVRQLWSRLPSKAVEASFARTYDAGDGLIVQCRGLAEYWRKLGLQVPIHTIPRPIDTAIFDEPLGEDPFPLEHAAGKRILVVCRHAREKDLDKVITAFAEHVLPFHPTASLTLVGDGQEHANLVRLTEKLGIRARCGFPGEKPQKDLRSYYAHADVFAYASLTETYGQVVSEAMWCGLPVVALDDRMGVAYQVAHEHDGLLVEPGRGETCRLGMTLAVLLGDVRRRVALGRHAAERARARVAPEVVYARYEAAYDAAVAHFRRRPPERFRSSSPSDWWSLLSSHVAPWTVQQSLLVALGALRGDQGSYVMPKERIDALPTPVGGAARPLEAA